MREVYKSKFRVKREYSSFFQEGGEEKVYYFLKRLKLHSKETFYHSFAVAKLAGRFGTSLGYEPKDVIRLNIAGLLHDIGKLNIPIDILHKEESLTEEEWNIMKQHVMIGYKMLQFWISDMDILLAMKQHHERYDGTGYPNRLKEGISDFAYIIMLADVFDGLTRKRSYRTDTIAISNAKEIMLADQGHYDRYYLDIFLNEVV